MDFEIILIRNAITCEYNQSIYSSPDRPVMAHRTNGRPLSVRDFDHAAEDRAMYYMMRLDKAIPGYGKQPTQIPYQTMATVINPAEKDGLIRWGAGRLSTQSHCLRGVKGKLIMDHVTNYVIRKYRSEKPFNVPNIDKIVYGVPYSISRTPMARLTITYQADNQRNYLQCLADHVELFAAIQCLDQILAASRSVQAKTKYVETPPEDPIFKPSSIVLRAAYELRIFYAINDLQDDAKLIIEAEGETPEIPETTGWHTTDPVMPDPPSDSNDEEEDENIADEASENETESDSESEGEGDSNQDDGYMEAEEHSSDNDDHPLTFDQQVPDLSHADDNHKAFIEALEEFLDTSRRRNEDDPNEASNPVNGVESISE